MWLFTDNNITVWGHDRNMWYIGFAPHRHDVNKFEYLTCHSNTDLKATVTARAKKV